jgi:3-deoxy-D-manno-octulosonic-acid transferase
MRTSQQQCRPETDVYLVDTMGELKMLYAAADVAFVGGSLVPKGGHNILEAAAVGVPVIFGPFMNNFKDIAGAALTAGAALQCRNEQDIIQAVLTIYQQPDFKQAMIEKGKAFVLHNRGATDAVYVRLIETIATSTT